MNLYEMGLVEHAAILDPYLCPLRLTEAGRKALTGKEE